MQSRKSADSTIYFCMGSVPLCKKTAEPMDDKHYKSFANLQSKLRSRLESFANVQILSPEAGTGEYSVRIGDRSWRPVGEEEILEDGHWIFSEYFKPILFRFHLPAKLQEKVWSWPSSRRPRAEDVVIAYNGMTFLAGAQLPEGGDTWSLAPTVRAYLQKELLASIPGFAPATIPPSPIHLDIRLTVRKVEYGQPIPGEEIHYDSPYSIEITRWEQTDYDLGELVEDMYYAVGQSLHEFYHLMIDLDVADKIYDGILNGSKSVYRDYESLLAMTSWRPIKKHLLHKDLSRRIAALQYSFCEHSLALAQFQRNREEFLERIQRQLPLKKASEYFDKQTKAREIDYSVFRSSLEHMGTHVLSLVQNRYLMYAALLGSAITLAGTLIGYLLSKR